jgi:rubrerythrin
MPHWTSDDLPWDSFDRAKLDGEILKLVKAASLTEYNAARYTAYLKNVFDDDTAFHSVLTEWQLEEEQHGRVLGRYAELAEPGYDFAATFKAFYEGYEIPVDVRESVRGSKVGELISRCIVETGTSSFYTALADAVEEPLLHAICKHIAADEFRHYRTFLDGIRRYQPSEGISLLARIRVMIQRVRESDDDELAFAYHCANEPHLPYDRDRCNNAYAGRAYGLYRPHHAERVVRMIFKAGGLPSQGWLSEAVGKWAWRKMHDRAARLAA